jgi:hypothetical protein
MAFYLLYNKTCGLSIFRLFLMQHRRFSAWVHLLSAISLDKLTAICMFSSEGSSRVVRSGEQGGQAHGPPRPIQWSPWQRFNYCYLSTKMRLSAAVMSPHIWCDMEITSSKRTGSSFCRKLRQYATVVRCWTAHNNKLHNGWATSTDD